MHSCPQAGGNGSATERELGLGFDGSLVLSTTQKNKSSHHWTFWLRQVRVLPTGKNQEMWNGSHAIPCRQEFNLGRSSFEFEVRDVS